VDNKLKSYLEQKVRWVWEETLKIHKIAPETRVASSLSDIEIFVALYYGKILKYQPEDQYWEGRDRFIVSKGHGSISMYPILADLGFFDKEELKKVCKSGSFLGGIPDPVIPGYETVNGSLGHGLGVACGMALALKRKKSDNQVFVMVGDGELYEGSNWEAIMFAAHHQLDNLNVIVDNNRICMLGYTENILDHGQLGNKFNEFGWDSKEIDGHDLEAVYEVLSEMKGALNGKPKVLIANTLKGKGVPGLENQKLSHIMTVKPEQVDELTGGGEQ
jgi:transketolase